MPILEVYIEEDEAARDAALLQYIDSLVRSSDPICRAMVANLGRLNK